VSNGSRVIEYIDFQFFRAFGRYVFGTVGNEANIVIQYYLVPLVAFPLTLKYMILYDHEWLNGHFTLNSHYYELALALLAGFESIFHLFTVESVYITLYTVPNGEVREAE